MSAHRSLARWLPIGLACLLLAAAIQARGANLVDAQWLERNLGAGDLLLLDASGSKLHTAKHIPGAFGIDLYRYGAPQNTPAAVMESRIQSWGVSPGKRIVIYDEGAGMMATWLFFELYYHGYPASHLFVLDGGLAKWEASGGAVTKDKTPAPAKGTFRVTQLREEDRVRLAEFVTASGDTANHAIIDALEPSYHFGGAKFFDRPGHVPNAHLVPVADFFNADKTFKSAEEIRRIAEYHGIKPGQRLHSHCGGGVAATVPYFAFKFVAGHGDVKLYRESQLEWLQDERGLPFWTYSAPYLKRDAAWLNTWTHPMMRMYGVTKISIIDVRPPEAYAQNHIPYSVNVPAEAFRENLGDPQKLAQMLAAAGVNPAHEAVIVSSGGLNERSALAFVALQQLGQKKVSLLVDSMDDWGLKGFTLTKEPTLVGIPKSMKDVVVPPTSYPVNLRDGVLVRDARATQGAYPKVFVASGRKAPDKPLDGKVVHVPFTDLVNADGSPKAANEIWNVLAKAGVPRYAEIVLVGEELGEAAANYFVFRLMGWPDVKVLAAS